MAETDEREAPRFRVVVAPDKYKRCLAASEVAKALARGVSAAAPDAEVVQVPVADGGEGTVEALVAATGGTFRHAAVTGPLGAPVRARFGVLGDGQTAVIEMAAASGLALIPEETRDPTRATTRGTGELILAAQESGARRIIIGIGGSATNDGGAGLAQALGYRLLDANGAELPPGGLALERLDRIERGAGLELPRIDVACDVDNPLCGPRGASAIYGPQKGATPRQVETLDRALANLARVLRRDLGRDVANLPGAGAAGGLGAGLVAFADGRLERGIELVLTAVRLDEHLAGARLCLTGEGAIDASSAHGKAIVGVAGRARARSCPVIAIAGTIGPGASAVQAAGINAMFSICDGPRTRESAQEHAAELLARTSEHVVRTFLAGANSRRAT